MLSCLTLALALPAAAQAPIPAPTLTPVPGWVLLNATAEDFFRSWFVDRDPVAAARSVSRRLDDLSLVPNLALPDDQPRPASNADIVALWAEFLGGLLPEPPANPSRPRALERLILPAGDPLVVEYLARKRGSSDFPELSPIGDRLLASAVRSPDQRIHSDSAGLERLIAKGLAEGLELRGVIGLFRSGRPDIPYQPVISYWAAESGGWKLWGIAIVPVM